jgi:hypothetical protein
LNPLLISKREFSSIDKKFENLVNFSHIPKFVILGCDSNAGPTLCRMMKVALNDQVGRNILSYVDDIVVVSKKRENYISDLAETFTNMCMARCKLNPEKCVFGITKGKVLGCLVSTKGIEASPDKIKAITQMQPL